MTTRGLRRFRARPRSRTRPRDPLGRKNATSEEVEMPQSLSESSLARVVSRGIAAFRSRFPARRAGVHVQADEDVEPPPVEVQEVLDNAVAHLPEAEKAEARRKLVGILARHHDAALIPYPRWLSHLLDRSRTRP